MAGMKPKNIIRKYSNESSEKLSYNGGKNVRILRILIILQQHTRDLKYMTNGCHTDNDEIRIILGRGTGSSIRPMMRLGIPLSIFSSPIGN